MRKHETETANRMLKNYGLPSLDEPGVLEAMARLVDSHDHFTKLLKRCEPEERRNMYEAMAPHLRFKAKPLEDYIIAAKEYAETAELPRLDADGNLLPYAYTTPNVAITPFEIPEFELRLQCSKCRKESIFSTERKADAIAGARDAGWAFDEFGTNHVCPNCLDVYAEEQLIVECCRCKALNFFYGARRSDAIQKAREAGWSYDQAEKQHVCPECMKTAEASHPLDPQASQKALK